MRIYVASSWRNEYQPQVVKDLRRDGHDVYDFKDSDGFHWSEVDPSCRSWTPNEYLKGLGSPCANRGFDRDMSALVASEALVMVMPCGVSASMELGWAVGNGKPSVIYVPKIREPDLMVKMASLITADFLAIRQFFAAPTIRVTA